MRSLELCVAAAEASAEPQQPSLPSAAGSGPSEGADAPGAAPQAPAQPVHPDAAVQPSQQRSVCAAEGCGRTSGLKRCAGCGAVRYCRWEWTVDYVRLGWACVRGWEECGVRAWVRKRPDV